MFNKMFNFIRTNWKAFATGTAAFAVAALAIAFPPALVGTMASSSVFGAFGSYAAAVATATFALASAATFVGVAYLASKSGDMFNWAKTKWNERGAASAAAPVSGSSAAAALGAQGSQQPAAPISTAIPATSAASLNSASANNLRFHAPATAAALQQQQEQHGADHVHGTPAF